MVSYRNFSTSTYSVSSGVGYIMRPILLIMWTAFQTFTLRDNNNNTVTTTTTTAITTTNTATATAAITTTTNNNNNNVFIRQRIRIHIFC